MKAQATKKPNILVIWGDDIGIHNISRYSHGMMGYQTRSIDRIGREGALFTDFYAQQSCTTGRASFILGQHPFRTGLLTIGMPGSPHGIPDWTPPVSPTWSRSSRKATPRAAEPSRFTPTATTSFRLKPGMRLLLPQFGETRKA